ncbi:MAG: TetR/AcrR family transcriptional regulator [Bifidobacterium sp.]|jgi:AcrR family transcriptional regulator|nr:TetR/AcrR family transcriptional regulator [Bifidobacterium sp.]MCH4175499.1 TetR/AcrR family transcriptional regulator [Bifidobacterium sp.]
MQQQEELMVNRNPVEDLFAQTLDASDLSTKQKAVLQASLTLFSAQGYDRTSTQQIAELAHVSQGTVYKRFATKHDILEALIEPFIDEIIPRLATEFTETVHAQHLPDFGDYLSFVVHDRLELLVANRKLVRILLAGVFNNQDEATAMLSKVSQAIHGVEGKFTEIFAYYQHTEQLVHWPVPRIVQYTAATIISHALPAILMSDDEAMPIDVDQASKEIAAFLQHGLSPASTR